ncbi:MAG TPA: hypothetical protein VGB74_19165 [Actinoplanes sp.]|jgi:hypothetical protein
MTSNAIAQAGTALSPEWDHGFDEAFTELISSDPDLVRTEFDDLIGANFEPPAPPEPPAPTTGQPAHRPTPPALPAGPEPGAATNTDPHPPP